MRGCGARVKIKTLAEQDETLRKIEVQAKRHAVKRERKRRARGRAALRAKR